MSDVADGPIRRQVGVRRGWVIAVVLASAAALVAGCTPSAPSDPPGIGARTAMASVFAGTGSQAAMTPKGWDAPAPDLAVRTEAAADAATDRAFLELCAAGADFDPFLDGLMSGDPAQFRIALESMGAEVVHRLKEDGNLELGAQLRGRYPAFMIALAGVIAVSPAEASQLDAWTDDATATFAAARKKKSQAANALCSEEVK